MSTTNSPVTVAIAGITGKLGRLVAKHLLSNPTVRVHGIGRNPDKLPEDIRSNGRFQAFRSDMKDIASLRAAVNSCSILISALSSSSPEAEASIQKVLIDACVAEGVSGFMPNDFTLEWRTADLNLLPQKRPNEEILAYLEERKDNIKHVHVLNGGFLETLFGAGFWFPPDKSPSEGLQFWGTGDEKWELTSYDHTAQFAAAVALDQNATGFLRVLGDRLTIKQIAGAIENIYGTPKIPLNNKGSLKDLEAIVRKGLEENPNSEDFWYWKAQSYILFLTNGQAYLRDSLDTERYAEAVRGETLEMWLQDRKLDLSSKSMWF